MNVGSLGVSGLNGEGEVKDGALVETGTSPEKLLEWDDGFKVVGLRLVGLDRRNHAVHQLVLDKVDASSNHSGVSVGHEGQIGEVNAPVANGVRRRAWRRRGRGRRRGKSGTNKKGTQGGEAALRAAR